MTENGRKGSSSKWDLKEGPRLLPREHNDDRKRRPGNKERQPRRRYGEENYKEGRESLDATGAWDGEPTYGTRMSPGLDDWRKQRHNRSPKSGRGRSYRSRSRSRSRSPERGFKRTGSYDRGIGPQSYPHQDYKDYEDRRYSGSGQTDSWEGRHRRNNNTSKYYNPDDSRDQPLMTGRSNDFSKRSANDFSREREIDRRDNRVASFDHNRNHEHRRSGGIIPCKFFAAGNCRNGNFCRFSHHGQTRDSSDNGGQNDWEQPINNRIDNMDPPREGSRWRGTHVPKWNEARNGGHEFPEQMEIPRSEDDRFMVHQMDSDIAIEESSDREYTELTAEITDNHVGDMELELSPAHNYRLPSPGHIVGEEPGHVFKPSKFSIQDEVSSQTCQQDIHREVNHKHQTVEDMQPFISQTQYFQQGPSLEKDAVNGFSCENGNAIGGSTMPHSDVRFSAHIPENKNEIDLNFSSHVPAREGFDQNGQTSSQLLSVLNKNQQIYESFSYTGGIQQPSREGQSSNPPVVDNATTSEVISDDPSNQNTVSNEQLSNLTVSLARFLESGKQLPELYAALNVPNSMGFIQSSISSSTGPAFPTPVSNQSQQVSAVGLQKQYDTASDSMQLIKPGINKLLDEVAPNSSENKIFLDEKSDIPSLPGGVDPNIKIQQSSREDPNDSCKDEENNTPEVGERNKGKDNGTLEKTKGDGKADENKKSNDAKNLRAFKFSLAEFVKEVLKPKWKEGQINKESHKTIVKKVVDKVTGSTQGVHIPQSQEKIDSYLSSNKPKLSKLVQAYVEKIQKEKPAVA